MGSAANAPHDITDVQESFLVLHGWCHATRSVLPGDFSARVYVRLREANRNALLMVMPQPSELAAFLSMQEVLEASGLRVPAVYASDVGHGLALIEDFGDRDFTSMLRRQPPEQLYAIAVDALSYLHHAAVPSHLPHFTSHLFLEQVTLFLENYAVYVMKAPFSAFATMAFENAWRPALERACAIPCSLMLRDYHAANIMYLEHETGYKKAAIIDFQDGGLGPLSYDLASLLEDARLEVSSSLRAQMIEHYLNASPYKDNAAFMTSYHILACQRHMRILGILVKRWRSGISPMTEDYFKRVWSLMMLHGSEPLLKPVYQWLDTYVPLSMRSEWKPSL